MFNVELKQLCWISQAQEIKFIKEYFWNSTNFSIELDSCSIRNTFSFPLLSVQLPTLENIQFPAVTVKLNYGHSPSVLGYRRKKAHILTCIGNIFNLNNKYRFALHQDHIDITGTTRASPSTTRTSTSCPPRPERTATTSSTIWMALETTMTRWAVLKFGKPLSTFYLITWSA